MLELIHAGAGSGKTHALCEIAVQRIVAGMRPERLLATTFTRRSAAELKQRIASALLACERLSPSQRRQRVSQLEGALIGTIHSVAHTLVTRHAYALGLSPRLRVIDESVAEQRLRDVLGQAASARWERISETARTLGIDQPETLVLQLLAAMRDNRIDDDTFRHHLKASAQRVCEICADGGEVRDGGAFERLDQLVGEAQWALEEHTDDTKVTEQARVQLRRLAHQPSRQWRSFLDAAKLKAGTRSGADALLDPLRRFAANVRYERQLHDTICGFVDAVCEETLRLDHAYAASKRTSASADFIDLERLFLQLLESGSVSSQLHSDIELVLVDEFQDVSPLQLAIFTRLRTIAARSHWVGDAKQAIYGFRGSDPELVRRHWNLAQAGEKTAVVADAGSQVRQLRKNYRSAAGLVALCGELFADPLGPEARQTAVRADAGRVERWVIESKNIPTDLLRLVVGIAGLIGEGTPAGEIAILARSNSRLSAIAAELQRHGVRSRLEQPGLMRTREGVLLMAGLRVVADRFDSLAAATLCHLLSDPEDSTPGWLAERLAEIGARDTTAASDPRDGTAISTGEVERASLPWDGHPLLTRLRQIDPRWSSPAAVTAEVVEALHLGRHMRRWGTPARRASHIDTVLQLAADYEQTSADAGAPATLAGFIHQVEKLAETDQDVRRPPTDSDAVTLLTYHGTKGLEFPTVVLFDLDHDRQAEPWGVSVCGGGAADDPTRDRTLRYWPWPFGRNSRTGALLSGTQVERTARNSAEGQEAARAAREESVRLLYVGFTRARDHLVLAHRVDQSAWLDQLPAAERWLPLDGNASRQRDDSGPGVTWDYRVRHLTDETPVAAPPEPAADWFDSGAPLRRSGLRAAAWHAPSRQEPTAGHRPVRLEMTGAAALFPASRDREEFRRVGDSVHAYLAALASLRGCDRAVRIRCAARCVEKFETAAWLSPLWLIEAGESFRRWSDRQWPAAAWLSEIPFTARRDAGGGWRGIADLLIETGDGEVVIVDHKSTPLRTEDCESAAISHTGQLAASREALSAAGLRVVAAYVHFPLAGRVAAMG